MKITKHSYILLQRPMTTTISENVAKSHDSIFNVINSDDIIAEMPLSYWGFRHYGNDVSTSVAENYSNEWQSYTSKSYSSNQSKEKRAWIPLHCWQQTEMTAMNFIALVMGMVAIPT